MGYMRQSFNSVTIGASILGEGLSNRTERVQNKRPTETDLRRVIINEFKSLKSAFSISLLSIISEDPKQFKIWIREIT